MNLSIPPGHAVRFDYHKHPRSITAVVYDLGSSRIRAVGVAKHNPTDEWNQKQGEDIALHRALRTLNNPEVTCIREPRHLRKSLLYAYSELNP